MCPGRAAQPGGRSSGGSELTSPSLPTPSSQVCFHNRNEALELDGQANDDEDEGLSRLEGSPKARQPTPRITTTSVMKKKKKK